MRPRTTHRLLGRAISRQAPHPPSARQSAPIARHSWPSAPEHGLAPRPELAIRFALRGLLAVEDPPAQLEHQARVLGRPREVPAGLHLVAHLVIVVLRIVVDLLLGIVVGLAEILPPRLRI